MAKIHFFTEDCPFALESPAKTRKWIREVIQSEGFTLKELSFVFASDEYVHRINLEYLNHDTYTDIITFDNSDDETCVEGDIFISIPRVRENAGKLHKGFDDELHRVIIHGVLHLIGYSDKKKAEKLKMREKEDTYLSLRSVPRGT